MYYENHTNLSNLRIFILFSHKERLVLLEATISGMKFGQLCGHSCFNIYSQKKKYNKTSLIFRYCINIYTLFNCLNNCLLEQELNLIYLNKLFH